MSAALSKAAAEATASVAHQCKLPAATAASVAGGGEHCDYCGGTVTAAAAVPPQSDDAVRAAAAK